MTTANDVLRVARAELGYKESPSGSNKTKYGKEYGLNGQPWCAIFVWWVCKHAGDVTLFCGGKKDAYCPTIADYYIAHKQTVSKSSGVGGDIVLFNFGKKNSQHIGFIEKKNADGSYTTIEGNTSTGNNCNGGMVMRRTRYQSQISWIVRPKYNGKPAPPPSPADYKLKVDGEWGTKTTATTQYVLGGLEIDGVLGKATVKAIQKKVGCKADGVWGADTTKAMQRFVGAKVDGEKGKETFSKWQKWLNQQINAKVNPRTT